MAEDLNNSVPSDNVNIVGPDGLGSVAPEQAAQYLNSPLKNYRLATPEDLKEYQDKEKYESIGQRTLAGAEEVAKSATFGLSTGLERGLSKLGVPGLTPEDIQKREEHNPGILKTGESLLGLAGSALIPGAGEANLLKGGAELGAAKLGLGAERAATRATEEALASGATKEAANLASKEALQGFSTTEKIGSLAAKTSIETMGFQAGDEVSKMFSEQSDPNHPLQTALFNIGLSGLFGAGLGAGIGSVSPLWKAVNGPQVSQVLQSIRNKIGSSAVSDATADMMANSAADVSPKLRAVIEGNPLAQRLFQEVQQSPNSAGRYLEKEMGKIHNAVNEQNLSFLGKTTEDVEAAKTLSDAETGRLYGKKIIEDYKAQHQAVIDGYKEISGKLEKVPFNKNDVQTIQEALGTLSLSERLHESPSSPSYNFIQNLIREMPLKKDAQSLEKLQSRIAKENPFGSSNYDIAKKAQGIIRESQMDILQKQAETSSAELGEQLRTLRPAYKAAAEAGGDLLDRLSKGNWKGPQSFLESISEMMKMEPEALLRKLDGKGDASWLESAQKNYPQAAKVLKDYHIDSLLKKASANAPTNQPINSKTFFSEVKSLSKSPEMRQFVLSPEAQQRIEGNEALLKVFAEIPKNYSNTAPTLLSKLAHMPAALMAVLSTLLGHGPLTGGILGELGTKLATTGVDHLKLGILKFLGSNNPIEASGFKAMVDFIGHVQKGDNLLGKSVKNLFESGKIVLPTNLIPDDKSRKKLDAKIDQLKVDPSPLFDIGGHTHHYLPEQAPAMGTLAANVINILAPMKPGSVKQSPLDTEVEPTKAEMAPYYRALDLAEQPLMAFQHIKDGTLTAKDVQLIQTLYPEAKQRMDQKIMEQLAGEVKKENHIPYQTRQGLSLFLGQPLDSTMTPQSIQFSQQSFAVPNPQKQGMPHKPAVNSFKKLSSMDETLLQRSSRTK